jgi:hypothetical protein
MKKKRERERKRMWNVNNGKGADLGSQDFPDRTLPPSAIVPDSGTLYLHHNKISTKLAFCTIQNLSTQHDFCNIFSKEG